MAKLNSRVNAKRPVPSWKQLHHWQGLGLVLFMLPLGTSLILGSVALEQANRQGLPEPGWADELAQDLGNRFAGTSIAKAVQWTDQGIDHWRNHGIASLLAQGPQIADRASSAERPKRLSLRRRQRRVIKPEIDGLSEQTRQRLAEAIVSPATLNSLPASPATAPNPTSMLRLSIAPDLRNRASHSSLPPHAQPPSHSPEEVAHFLAIALGTEFTPSGQAIGIPHIRKWVQDLRIRVNGTPTPKDIETLEQVVVEINDLIGTVELGFVEQDPNLEIFFLPERDFGRYEASYHPVNHGFFWSEANQGVIQRGRILISTTDINQTERSHLIREELTQSLGLMQDSLTDAHSIFFQGWSQTQAYSERDKRLLTTLYRPDIHPGMDAVAVQQVLLGS